MKFLVFSSVLSALLSSASGEFKIPSANNLSLFDKLNGNLDLDDKHRGLMYHKGKGKGGESAKSPKSAKSSKSKGSESESAKGKGGESAKGKGGESSKGKGGEAKGKGSEMSKGKGGESAKGKGKGGESSKGKGKGGEAKGKGKGKGYECETSLKDIVVDTEELTILEIALETADLLDAFDAKDLDATVLAPLDSGFEALAEAEPKLFEALLTKPWELHLDWLLFFHVTAGSVLSKDLSDGMEVEMGTGETLTVSIDGDSVCFVNPQQEKGCVVIADIVACNGVAHAIDAVLLPYYFYFPVASLAVAAQDDYKLTTLVDLVVCADLAEALDTTFGITVFAPTDDAFEGADKDFLCSEEGLPTLTNILTYHVVPEVLPSTQIGGKYMTLQGEYVEVSSSKYGVKVNGAEVLTPDLLAKNGIVHIIDEVLFPKGPAPSKGKGKGKGGESKGKGKGGESKGKGKGGESAKGKGKGGESAKGKGGESAKGKGKGGESAKGKGKGGESAKGKGKGSESAKGKGGEAKGKGSEMSSKSAKSAKSSKSSKSYKGKGERI